MTGFLGAITLGDGDIPLLGDAWLGEIPTQGLLAAAKDVTPPIEPQAPECDSGLVPLASGPWRAVVRAGPHAADEQMGHAHADLLSFDASHGASRVVTDTGTLLYDAGSDRQRIRGTAAHNTLRLDGEEQLEAWDSFRVGRRGRARVLARGHTAGWDWVSASHDAWCRLAGRPVHHRLVAVRDSGILILDAVRGAGRHRIESHLHEHPDCDADIGFVALGSDAGVDPAPLHERFGETRPMQRHRLELDTELPWTGGWWIARSAGPDSGATLNAIHLDVVVLRLTNPRIALEWRPSSTDPREALISG